MQSREEDCHVNWVKESYIYTMALSGQINTGVTGERQKNYYFNIFLNKIYFKIPLQFQNKLLIFFGNSGCPDQFMRTTTNSRTH
jgi:hypothetical protein